MIRQFIEAINLATGNNVKYVLTLERHDGEKTSDAKRGSLHAHLAVSGRQDYKLLGSVWNHRICKGQGFVHVNNGTKKMNTRAIAGYISKYIGKELEEVDFNKKSYWISQNIEAPEKTCKLFKTMAEAVAWLTEFYDAQGAAWGTERWRCWMDSKLGVFWLPAG
jgi:hypothetical protein